MMLVLNGSKPDNKITIATFFRYADKAGLKIVNSENKYRKYVYLSKMTVAFIEISQLEMVM